MPAFPQGSRADEFQRDAGHRALSSVLQRNTSWRETEQSLREDAARGGRLCVHVCAQESLPV